jgi:hypothetical protein
MSARWSGDGRAGAQDLQQLGGEHDVAVFLPLAVLDAQVHPLAIDRRNREVHGFRDPKAGGVTGRQDRAMLRRLDALKKRHHLARSRRNSRRRSGRAGSVG